MTRASACTGSICSSWTARTCGRRRFEHRKSKLEKLLAQSDGIRFSEHLDGDGAIIFAHACKLGLEGIVSKRRDLLYRCGPCNAWKKIKNARPRTPDLRRDRPCKIQWNQLRLQHFLIPKPPETRKKLQLENPADALPSSGPTPYATINEQLKAERPHRGGPRPIETGGARWGLEAFAAKTEAARVRVPSADP
jgi:hypothetical protein